ncbi:vWA domain-containing protein [Methylophaga sp. OBS4]|uniref:vWA domain-containing protein n=1 Tax=Methylophaga sp. OBS4 TaxID=2991935 RepID=UPI002251E0A6|nr:vWA domain-containing protein [Methylophaga sp. OBS4]MCX4187119.1 VWA domain-containing protein [Methylophaga sp. OBS4]
MLGLDWTLPYLLYLLPLGILPWLSHNTEKTIAWDGLLPHDRFSGLLSFLHKSLAMLVIIALIIALAGPYTPEKVVERYRQGAEFILLLDRSRSMDDIFARRPLNTLPIENEVIRSKRSVSRDYLAEFVKRRPDDRFGYVFFSDKSTEILRLTYNKDAILATINAGGLGKGISKTNIFSALRLAAEMYEREVYRGSRNVLLISDGGQTLSEQEKAYLKQIYPEMKLNLYWIYLRSMRGMTLDKSDEDSLLWLDMPERKLHEFFKQLDVSYQAFEAGSMQEFADAINEIDRQQYQTLIVEERIPHQSQADSFLWVAFVAMLLLAVSQLYTLWGVRQAYHVKRHQ